jgi:hypothetical protein
LQHVLLEKVENEFVALHDRRAVIATLDLEIFDGDAEAAHLSIRR